MEKRLIDANALMERFAEMQKVKPDEDGQEYACNFRNIGGEPSTEWFAVEDAVENAPTVDAVPVVRCGECKHFIEPSWECRKLIDRDAYGEADARVYPDYFCADGEQKDGESRLHCENTCADGERRTDEQQSKG